MRHLHLLILFMVLFSTSALAAVTDSVASKGRVCDFALRASLNTSAIIPTNAFLRENRDNNVVISPDLRAAFSFSRDSRLEQMYPGVRQGIGVSGNFILPHSSLGSPVSAYLFQDVCFLNCSRWSLSAEWNFGVSAGWSHFADDKFPVNSAIGSNVNALLGVGLTATYHINDTWALSATANAIHYSNGNTKLPNAGVNSIGMRLGLIYSFDPLPRADLRAGRDFAFRPGMEYDLTVYGATRQRATNDSSGDIIILPGNFGVCGLNFAPMYAFSRYFRAGVSADFQYDESANIGRHLVPDTYGDNVKFYRQSFAERFSAGLSLRAELTLPVFSINFGVGRNIIADGPDTRIFYQTLALKARIWRGTFVQIGYQLGEFHLPNNLMLGIGYTFSRQ